MRKKHASSKKQKRPSPLLERCIYIVAFAGPLMTLPQIYDIWVARRLLINEITWMSYLIIGFVWLYYGIIHKEKLIIYSNILGILTTGLVVLGALVFR